MKFNKVLLKTKLKASAVHLGISLIIFIILAYQIYYVWYPQPYFSVDGGWQGMRIIAAVDLVLGPLVTFVIFDYSKERNEILFDLMIIVVVQIGALIYGVATTYDQRPVAIVLSGDFFLPVLERDYGSQLGSMSQLERYSAEKPPIIWSHIPLDRTVLDEVLRIKARDNIVDYAQIQLYQPPEKLLVTLQQRQINTLTILGLSGAQQRYDEWLEQNKKTPDEVLLGVFKGRYGQIWLVFDSTAKYIDYFR
jgi:hypothetical protein